MDCQEPSESLFGRQLRPLTSDDYGNINVDDFVRHYNNSLLVIRHRVNCPNQDIESVEGHRQC